MEKIKLSLSGSNIVNKSHIGESVSSKVKKLFYYYYLSSFIAERVKSFWNHLPVSVRNYSNVELFKANLESFEKGWN